MLYKDTAKTGRGALGQRGHRDTENYAVWDTATLGSDDAICTTFSLQHKFLKREVINMHTLPDPKTLCGHIKKVLMYGRGSVCK